MSALDTLKEQNELSALGVGHGTIGKCKDWRDRPGLGPPSSGA